MALSENEREMTHDYINHEDNKKHIKKKEKQPLLSLSMVNALIIVDIQEDFCDDGSLAVPRANEVIPIVNALRERVKFDYIFFNSRLAS